MGAIDNTNAPPAEKEASASTEVKKEGMSAPPPAESGASAPTEVKKEGTSAPPAESGASAPIEVKKEGTSAPPAENGAKRIDDRDRTDQNNRYSLKLKSEFVLSERASSLTPMEKVEDTRGVKVDDRDNQSGKKGKKFKNKKRPRDARQDDSEKICMSVIRGDKCSFGEGCKFSHDIKAYMATRPADITEVEGCPNYNLHGYCTFGVACRFGGCHINKAGENIHKDAVDTPGVKPDVPLQETSINSLPRDVQIQLRKNKYDFKCKRHFETKKDKEEPKEGEVDKSESPKNLESSTPVELKTRKIIDFANKVYVAPLTTVGNLPFRRMMKKFGADITCGEMAIATCLLEGKPSEWALLKRHPDEDVFGVQVAAAHPDQYTRACELIEEFCTVDFVDLNLGCPLDLVCSKGAGAALMNREKKLRSSLEGINKTLSCPFTVKMRTGWDMAKPFAHQLVPKIQSWGIDGIGAFMVHGRSRLQRYSKQANWDYISEVAKSQSPDSPQIPLIGNGDIMSYTDYEEKVAREGVSATAMLARGALIKPWLPTEIKERRHWDISASERLDMLKDYVRFGLEHWGSDQQGVNNTRRFLLEWLSFLHRYVPVGLLEVVPQEMNQRPPSHICGRNDLETLFLSAHPADWIKISEMLLGPVPKDFKFEPKHKAAGYA